MLSKQDVKMMLDRGDHFIDEFVELTLEEVCSHTYEEFIELLNKRTKLMWLPYTNIRYNLEAFTEGFFYAKLKFKIRFFVNNDEFYKNYDNYK